ncbi:PREDICTED: LOW QUALITY PROTEIN: mucin-12 [Dinoponera quadriceps]|uniref:LOW QUALITY PROTEIN: mucin-12 n=1 Tax=Dinoponera quadriceps TaxID=609295 RepID=A0A6P3WQM0_DINQU|nr:PREDICTED: LOW QUALITY PROTEIN: mucin-12 [Dinoponera quadriceps]
MDGDMWRLWFTKLLLLVTLLLAITAQARSQDAAAPNENIRASRIERDLQEVTTVLLVSARPGQAVPPVGLLTKTARTFVQDGASTEFATQILGTTLDNGRLYARILSTSSRVFYDREPTPASPYVVYPSRAPEDDWQLRVALENAAPIRAIEEIEALGNDSDADSASDSAKRTKGSGHAFRLDELSRENDVFSKRELNMPERFKPAKVRPTDTLPTYTVKQEYVTSSFDALDEAQPKSYRPRLPKIFKSPSKGPAQRRPEAKPLATVTYHGFADFTTTVGETVIVFSPSTSPAPVGPPATTIKVDATLRPNDGPPVMRIRPTTVLKNARTEQPHEAGASRASDDQLLRAINHGQIQASVTEEVEPESSTVSTEPLPDVETDSLRPTGLLKVVDSTTSLDGTTTHYKSLIYGTYIGKQYAEVTDTSSNVYFFPDEATVSYGADDTTLEYGTTETDEPEQGTTVEMSPSTTPGTTTIEEEMNELTTPLRGTTDSVLTTLKDILESARRVLGTTESVLPMLDDEIPNDIVPGDPQGRSIKGGSQNDLQADERKLHGFDSGNARERTTLATRLLPSTVYKTFTYFTTFFIPDEHDRTTTSIRSREVVSSEVTYLTELIRPSASDGSIRPTTSAHTTQQTPALLGEVEEEQTTKQDEEIELIFKTLYTTYTYLTTFFQENTSSVSSRQVVETNVITQTIGPNGVSAVVAGLFEKDDSVAILPTTLSQSVLPSVTNAPEEHTTEPQVYQDETTEGSPTTLQQRDTTVPESTPTESVTTVDDFETSDGWTTELEPSPTPAMATEAVKEQVKTYYTTYTYFTTIFVDDETEIETRTEVFTNVVTETITPTAVLPAPQETVGTTTPKPEAVESNKAAVPPEILAYLEALQRQKSQEEALLLAKKVQADQATRPDEPTTPIEGSDPTTTETPTTSEDRSTTERSFDYQVGAQVTPNPPTADVEVLGSMITDVVSSSSSGGGTVLDVMDKRNAVPEDQELSESNNHEVEPAPTLLLQTSYTTFTYFTTMYKGEQTNVASRLETVTNVVTETLRPSLMAAPEPTSTLPVTYFTTFTYWTTFYKGGDTVTTSREETVSNVVSPTPTMELGVATTYKPTVNSQEEPKVTADNEVTPLGSGASEKLTEDAPGIISADEPNNTLSISPTTFYTTFTYFTTSYVGNETILNSRLETVTSVSIPATQQATGRAIGGSVYPSIQTLSTEPEKPSVTATKVSEAPKTGLISTIRSSAVHEGTTTHYTTDVYGTYIDGLYAQVVESSTRTERLPSSSATPVLPTGVLSLNKGSVVDADEVTTVYFTTKRIGTLLDGLYAKVIESTSSTRIDEVRKASIQPTQGHRTGLVRLIQGQIEDEGTTTFYQSKVIGTSIEGRYAQIIESTSSFLIPSATIAPTSTLPPSRATSIPAISPSPAVIQSSLSEEPTTESADQDEESGQNEEEDEEGGEDEDDQSSKKKSRLTFSTRKRTFTPVIRPFASRNRPTFNPKRKGAQAATTITRSDITTTITATLAGKGNRFASSRGRVTSPIGPYSSTLSPSGSRRFAGRRGTATSSSSAFPAGSTRGRGQPRITPSSVFQGNRRGPTSIRGSSARVASRASSSAFPGASSRYRAGIRASSTLLRGQPSARHDDQENDANEFTTTTLFTDETLFTEYFDGETVTAPLQTTTESSRRSTNPLLRFRRPLGRSATTPRPPATTTPRRSGNLNRPSAPTVPRVTNGRANSRATPPVSTRSRPSNTGLFPPRGLLGGRKQEEELDAEDEEGFEDEPVEEISDNDYEGSEHEDRRSSSVNRRSGKSVEPAVRIRPFGARTRRVRRQAGQLKHPLSTRFRRPSQPAKAEDRSDGSEAGTNKEDNAKPAKPIARYNNRARSLTTLRPYQKTGNGPSDQSSAETAELGQQSKPRSRTKQTSSRNVRIKPSPASGSRQFTLRDKDSSLNRSGYKRPTSRANSRPKPTESSRVRPPRLRSGPSKSPTESPGNSRRVPPSRSTPRSANNNRNHGRRVPTRSRVAHEDIREAPTVYPNFDGTITVTHYVPTEVTIPVVNNGVTEQRNIVTAQPSTEVLGPSQYSTVVAGDGRPLVVIVTEVTGANVQGQPEVTRFLLHETATTRISHTLTSLGGRRVSQSVIVPTTVYSVENIVSTVQPSLPASNPPLANILLSQLLLGQLGQPNPLLQPQAAPTTRYNTRTTSYVTTITKQQSTVIPLTFRGKEILTTLVDSSTDVVTATEFITDTVVVTPTAAIPAANLNSLLLLLQQPQQPQLNSNPLLDPLFAAAPFTQSNSLPGEVERRHQPADSDYRRDGYSEDEEEDEEAAEYRKKPSRSRGKSNDAKPSFAPKAESSVVTLYVSGRRPGEFSTVLSTVRVDSPSRRRRHAPEGAVEVRPSVPPSLHAGPAAVAILAGSEDPIDAHAPTQSLESVTSGHVAVAGDLYDESVRYGSTYVESERDGGVDGAWTSANEDDASVGRLDAEDDELLTPGKEPRKRVRIRVPVVRGRSARQHKLTVVRRRPLASRSGESASNAPRRVVVTRVRSLSKSAYPFDRPGQPAGRHKVTITRRRKLQPTPVSSASKSKVRVTRKKLVAVRPIEPTPTFAIITTGFFTVASSEYEEEYSDEEETSEEEDKERVEYKDHTVSTPGLEEIPNLIDNKPNDGPASLEASFAVSEESTSDEPVIITDNFFFPPSDDEEDDDEEYEDEDFVDTTTTSENADEVAVVSGEDEQHATTEASFPNVEDNIVSGKSDVEDARMEDVGDVTTTPMSEIESQLPTEEPAAEMSEESDDALTNTVVSIDTASEEETTTEMRTDVSDDEAPTTTLIPIEETTEEQTTEESTTLADEPVTSSVADESTTDPPDEENTTIPDTTESPIFSVTEATTPEAEEQGRESTEVPGESPEEIPTVRPIRPNVKLDSSSTQIPETVLLSNDTIAPSFDSVIPLETAKPASREPDTSAYRHDDDSSVPSVIPLGAGRDAKPESTPATKVTSKIASPTPEEIEAGLADDLYLSLSRLDFPEILPSKPATVVSATERTPDLEPSTSVYYTETVVTSTRLRTYTYVVTQLNGLETKVTSSTTVRPRVTTLTLTVPVTVTVTPTVESSASFVSSVYNPVPVAGEYEAKDEEEGRRFNLATRVMSNGVEVIVAGPTPALRWENSNPQPTLTLSDAVVMLLPQDKPNEFVTKTCTTTFTYLSTITKDGTTTVSTEQQVVANTATEERHRKPGSETAAVTLEASPTLRTEVFKTTYTYLTLNTDHPDADDALESSTKVITNTVTAPQHYLDMILEPSEAPRPETNTYLSTRVLEKTFMEEGRTKVETISDTITQLIVTESAPPPRPTSVTTTLTALDNTDGSMTDITKTYYITYTYFNTFLEKGSTVVRTNVATSTDVVLEKVPVRKTTTKPAPINPTPEPIQIFATKTYLTTFTYFTTLLQAGPDGETSTTVTSRSHIVENVVTESIAPSLLDAGYMNALLTTAHHSDPVKNVVTGSTIIFFDEEDQIDPTTTTSAQEATAFPEIKKDEKTSASTTAATDQSSANGASGMKPDNNGTALSGDEPQNKRPSSQAGGDLQVGNLLGLGSLGINSLSALGPVITAMAGLLQGKTASAATRRNDTASPAETQEVTTQRSPIYIPVAEFADAAHLANLNHNYIAETRHKVTSSLADGIPISPGEVITANSDVIIGKPGKMAPRPPQTYLKDGMKPPPLPVPNIPVHPVLEVVENEREDAEAQPSAPGPQIQILPAHQVYEEHLKVPVSIPLDASHPTASKQPQKLHPIQPSPPPNRTGSKQDILANDPLLKPPDRPNVEQYANPNLSHKIPEWSPEKYRRPWSAKDPLVLPSSPTIYDEIHPDKPVEKSRPTILPSEEQKRPPWAQKDPLLPETSIVIQSSESKPIPTRPIVHQVPHVIDRSTGQPLLVNIQPSQVAKVVIPQGGTQALIFGDTNEPHISGQYFDDPSPYPEPEVGPGFVGVQKVQDLPQYSSEKDPADYMVPPSPPPSPVNFKPASSKPNLPGRPHAIPLSPVRLEYGKPQETPETPLLRPDKRPSEVHLIKRPDASGSPSQGHVHTEILVHHKPEMINIRPQPALSIHPHVHSVHQPPMRGHFSKGQSPMEQAPPRRTEVSSSGEVPHRYIFLGKPDAGNEITLGANWKSDKKPIRFALNNRPRPRPVLRPTSDRPLDKHVFVERPTGYPPFRKPTYTGPQRLPAQKAQNTFALPNRPQPHQEPTRIPPNRFTLQLDHEERPPHIYPENASNFATPHSLTEQNNRVPPTGAIEYHNPSYPASGDTKYPQVGAKPPEDQLEKWQTHAQTEQTLPDSAIDASEYVNYQNRYNERDNNSQAIGGPGKKDTLNSPYSHGINQSLNSQTPYGTVVSINAVVGKPLEVEQEPGVTFGYEIDGKPMLPGSHGADPYSTRPYELPVVQGKPFGVYNGYVLDPAAPYGYKQKEGKPDYEIVHGIPAPHNGHVGSTLTQKKQDGLFATANSPGRDDTIDLKPPAIIPHFGAEADRPGRPYPKPVRPDSRPVLYLKPEILTKPPIKLEVRPDYVVKRPGDAKPNVSETFANQTLDHGLKASHDLQNWNVGADIVKLQQKIPTGHDSHAGQTNVRLIEYKNSTVSRPPANSRPIVRPEHGTRVHPEYPHILTKPKPKVPEPVIVSSSTAGLEMHGRPSIKFSMPVEATGEEVDSKTQTERPPSMLVTKNNMPHNKKNDEILDSAYQTNFASTESKNKMEVKTRPINLKEMNIPSRNMMPPPLNVGLSQANEQEGLKPPPPPSSDVVGLSPPPVDITTTHIPMEDRFALMTTDESGLKPPKYVLLKESISTVAPRLPSTSMVPPNPRPSLTKPFLVELLSQDMVPPPPILTTTRPLEIATVRPAVAVSGSIQIATAVATSHIPVVQDIESKIPIIHGTVDLPVVVDVPDILKSAETRMTEHVSIYTVRPFDTKLVSRIPIQTTSTLSTNLVIPTRLRSPQVNNIQPSRSSTIHREVDPTKTHMMDIPPNPVKRPEHPIFLESSYKSVPPSTARVEPTESLKTVAETSRQKQQHPTVSKTDVIRTQKPQTIQYSATVNETMSQEQPIIVTRVDSSITKVTNTVLPVPNNKAGSKPTDSTTHFTKNVVKTTSSVAKDESNATVRTKPKEVTRFMTSTVTRTKTSVLGSPPTTRTLLLTHTITTTTVETVTETLLRPTSVVSTVTSTILQPIVTRIPSSYDNAVDNDSIFVVMSDQKPPAPGAEEVEAEYGEEVSRDEQDPTGNEVHRVLAGGVLGAPVVPLTPVTNQCTPECKSSKSEICAEVGTEMRCVCRPGFARMFPDRPCKPTYTYTLRVGLDRIGHESVAYETALNDSTSTMYKRLAVSTKDALDRTLMQSDLRDVYRGLKIAGFIPDPTKVEFHVQLSDNANETRLKEILRKYLVGSNYSLGGTEVYASKNLDMIEAVDFDECASKEGGPHHDCSPHAACFNLRGSYQCSCMEGWADLSENSAYPGRVCSQAPLGCAGCNNKGHCVTNSFGQEVCECFPWHSGQRCQVNLKVLLIALVTTGAILLGLLAVCVGMACFRQPGRDRKTGDRRAMIPGAGGDTSSEGSVTDLAIPHHVPHVLPPPPQMIAPLPPTNKRPIRKISGKLRHPPRKATMVPAAAIPVNDDQRDRSLTVMIPRAKYRSAPQSPQNYKACMSTFAAEEHKLINYLDNGVHSSANRKQSVSSAKDCKEAELQGARNPVTPTGALVSAGFQVSATVTRTVDAESTLARSCGETTVETATKVLRSGDLQVDFDSTLARSCGETTIQAPTKLLRLDLGEAGSTLARSCGETTIQPPTKVAAARRNSVKDTRDSASEGHTMAERDLGSTLRLPAQHPPLYSPDRTSDRESNFDSL